MNRVFDILGLKKYESKFWSRVNIQSNDECWEWKGRLNQDGYGQFDHNDTASLSHRFVWMVVNGNIPNGLEICHKCDNRKCCNPAHLFIATHKENIEDMVKKGRGANRNGERNGRAKLQSQDVIKIKKLRKEGHTYKGIAHIMQVSEGCISHILNGRHWIFVK